MKKNANCQPGIFNARLLIAVVLCMTGACLSVFALNPVVARGPLALQQRVAAQRAIEEVRWRHRLWPKENKTPKPSLSETVPDSAIQAKVEDALRKSSALATFWQRPVTGEQLQAEINRMVQNSKQPDMLREQFAVLNNDPQLIAETIARPLLADRLIRNWYSSDARFHGAVKAQAETALKNFNGDITQMKNLGGQYRETELAKSGPANDPNSPAHGLIGKGNKISLDPSDWAVAIQNLSTRFNGGMRAVASQKPSVASTAPSLSGNDLPLGQLSALQEDSERFYVRAILSKTADSLKVAEVSWQKTPFNQWWANVKGDQPLTLAEPSSIYHLPTSTSDLTSKSASASFDFSSAFPNRRPDRAGRLQPDSTQPSAADDTWARTREGVASERAFHSVVWTGSEMIVWGGYVENGTGARYDPSTDSWVGTTTAGAPIARYGHSAVWTGSEMIIWGGQSDSSRELGLIDGARYNPASDSWTPTSNLGAPSTRIGHTAIWTGTEMVVWGGTGLTETGWVERADGVRYDPVTDLWHSISSTAAPSGRNAHTAIWTGSEMIVWGGTNASGYLADGARYNAASDIWLPMATSILSSPGPRILHTAIWTGSEMIVWGGNGCSDVTSGAACVSGQADLADGGRYNPVTDTWTLTTNTNAPSARERHTAIWDGSNMIVWGGSNVNDPNRLTVYDTGGKYNPSTDSWLATNTGNAPFPRYGHTAVWTGSEMIVWGGVTALDPQGVLSLMLNSGGRYNPQSDSWVATATPPDFDSPAERFIHTAVWTGSEMIVWGGADLNGFPLDTGSRYDAATDSWRPTSPPVGKDATWGHTAVWTGQEMIVWGGVGFGDGRAGSKYNPSNDTWTAMTTANAPVPRFNYFAGQWFTTVWTGSEMIVWGGYDGAYQIYNTGGRYNPAANSWTPTSLTNAPTGRLAHTAVWTGSEMIVWGGYSGAVVNDGRRYNPTTDTWVSLSATGAPEARRGHTSVWTGSQMIVWGGWDQDAGAFLNSGAIYDPSSDVWTATDATGAPIARMTHSAIWTGEEMIIWGGFDQLGHIFHTLNSGARYSPISNTWKAITLQNVPSARYGHTAVWTGSDMIIWGGSPLTFSGGTYHVKAANQPPQIVGAVSRKSHGTAGTFDIDLPLAGNPGIECRGGGENAEHQVVVNFAKPVTVSGANVAPGSGGTASVSGAPVANGNQVTINLTNVSNAQTLAINLVGVSDGTSNGDVSVPMGVLLGDVNGTGVVSNTDVASVKAQVAAPVTSSNFRDDVKVNAVVSNTDVSTTKAQVGTSLP